MSAGALLPGGPVVKTLLLQSRGHRLDFRLGTKDSTRCAAWPKNNDKTSHLQILASENRKLGFSLLVDGPHGLGLGASCRAETWAAEVPVLVVLSRARCRDSESQLVTRSTQPGGDGAGLTAQGPHLPGSGSDPS